MAVVRLLLARPEPTYHLRATRSLALPGPETLVLLVGPLITYAPPQQRQARPDYRQTSRKDQPSDHIRHDRRDSPPSGVQYARPVRVEPGGAAVPEPPFAPQGTWRIAGTCASGAA